MSTEAVSTPITSTVFDTVLDIPHKPGYPVENNDHFAQQQKVQLNQQKKTLNIAQVSLTIYTDKRSLVFPNYNTNIRTFSYAT